MTDEQDAKDEVKASAKPRKKITKPAETKDVEQSAATAAAETAAVAAKAMAQIEADEAHEKMRAEMRQEILAELRAEGMCAQPSGGQPRPAPGGEVIHRNPAAAKPVNVSEMHIPAMPGERVKREDY